MANGNPETSQGIKDWLREVANEVKVTRETAIRTESKLEAYASRTGETETTLKAHDMRLNSLENNDALRAGETRMLRWLGGIIGGLVLIGQLAVMIIKG